MRRLTPRTAALMVAAAATALYIPSLWNGFAYDDPFIISLNTRIHDLARVPLLFTESYWPNEKLGLYRPLVMASFALDWAVSGGAAWWFHLVNLLWNTAASVLVFAVLLVYVPAGAALLGALLFAVHPVHVEAVANIVGRADVMAATFSLAAVLLWLRAPAAALSPRRMAAIGACYALALLTKESAIVLPALLVLADAARHELRPDNAPAWLMQRARPLAALAIVAVAFLAVRTAVLGELGPEGVAAQLEVTNGAADRARTALQAWPHFMRLLVYPRVLLPDYSPRVIMPALTLTPQALAGAIILAVLVGGGIIAWLRGRGRLAFVLLFLPVALLPVSNLIIPIGVLVAERALYLPSFALAAAVAFAAAAPWPQPRARALFAAAALVAALLFTARSLMRIPEWRTSNTVLAALRRDAPHAYTATLYGARQAALHGDVPLALQLYSETLNAWPHRHNVLMEAATFAAGHGALPFALQITDFALVRWPNDVEVIRMRAAIALDFADTVTARALIVRGLAAAPDDSLLLRMRAATSHSVTR